MNLHITNIIIQREYLNKVKKKSFLVTTFLVPVLFAALCVLPSVIMMKAREEAKKIAVVDKSSIVMPFLSDSETIQYADCSDCVADSIKTQLEKLGFDAVLIISELDEVERTVLADIYSTKPLGVEMTGHINSLINDAVEEYRIQSYNIEGLKEIMKDVKSNVKMKSYTMDDDGKETVSESGVYMILSVILGMIIYMFIALFGGMVMSGVIEEKSSRVVEVLISSVKATELMFGKIIGIALVALTQFLLWILLTLGIIGTVGLFAGKDLLSGEASTAEVVQDMSGLDADQVAAITDAAAGSQSDTASVIMGTLANMPIVTILVCFIIFFFFGYVLYASIFAAIGSAAESTEDTQQLQMPVTIPLLLAFFIALYAFKSPDGALSFWGSIIPFTSPIVMIARLPFGVPAWEIILSIALLIATCVLCAWASAKIYKVGILMFGKKSTWKDLWKWFRQN